MCTNWEEDETRKPSLPMAGHKLRTKSAHSIKGKGPTQREQLSAVITCEHQTPFSKPLPSSLPTNFLISHQNPETSPQDQVIPLLSHISQMTVWFPPMCHFPPWVLLHTVLAVLSQGLGADHFPTDTTRLQEEPVSTATERSANTTFITSFCPGEWGSKREYKLKIFPCFNLGG